MVKIMIYRIKVRILDMIYTLRKFEKAVLYVFIDNLFHDASKNINMSLSRSVHT